MPGSKRTASVELVASLSQRSDHLTFGQDCFWKACLCRAALQVDGYWSQSRFSPAHEWSPPSCPTSCKWCVEYLHLFFSGFEWRHCHQSQVGLNNSISWFLLSFGDYPDFYSEPPVESSAFLFEVNIYFLGLWNIMVNSKSEQRHPRASWISISSFNKREGSISEAILICGEMIRACGALLPMGFNRGNHYHSKLSQEWSNLLL